MMAPVEALPCSTGSVDVTHTHWSQGCGNSGGIGINGYWALAVRESVPLGECVYTRSLSTRPECVTLSPRQRSLLSSLLPLLIKSGLMDAVPSGCVISVL